MLNTNLRKTVAFLLASTVLSFGGTISGVVLDKKSSKPIPSAIITVDDKEYRTDEKGAFSLFATKEIGVRAIGYGRIFSKDGGTIYLESIRPKALYLSSYGATNSKILGNAKRLIRTTQLNALVIDIKMDRGQIAFKTSDSTAGSIGAQKSILFRDLPGFIGELKKEGIYTIARIVCFKDTPYVAAHPQSGVKRSDGKLFKDNEGLYWIDPSQKEAWKYIAAIAKESAKAGFDEIQLDYVRFPDRKGLRFAVDNTPSNRTQIIGKFLGYMRSQLTPYNVFIAADIFGYVSWNESDLGIGQTIGAVAKHVDYLSPMLYPSGYHVGIPGYRNPVKANYEIVKLSLDSALKKSGGSSLAYRPWLQSFRDYAFDRRQYGSREIGAQIKASDDFGSDGWMLWNPRNSYSADGL